MNRRFSMPRVNYTQLSDSRDVDNHLIIQRPPKQCISHSVKNWLITLFMFTVQSTKLIVFMWLSILISLSHFQEIIGGQGGAGCLGWGSVSPGTTASLSGDGTRPRGRRWPGRPSRASGTRSCPCSTSVGGTRSRRTPRRNREQASGDLNPWSLRAGKNAVSIKH